MDSELNIGISIWKDLDHDIICHIRLPWFHNLFNEVIINDPNLFFGDPIFELL